MTDAYARTDKTLTSCSLALSLPRMLMMSMIIGLHAQAGAGRPTVFLLCLPAGWQQGDSLFDSVFDDAAKLTAMPTSRPSKTPSWSKLTTCTHRKTGGRAQTRCSAQAAIYGSLHNI